MTEPKDDPYDLGCRHATIDLLRSALDFWRWTRPIVSDSQRRDGLARLLKPFSHLDFDDFDAELMSEWQESNSALWDLGVLRRKWSFEVNETLSSWAESLLSEPGGKHLPFRSCVSNAFSWLQSKHGEWAMRASLPCGIEATPLADRGILVAWDFRGSNHRLRFGHDNRVLFEREEGSALSAMERAWMVYPIETLDGGADD